MRRDVFLISQTHLWVLCKDVCSVKSPEEILEIHVVVFLFFQFHFQFCVVTKLCL